MKIYDDYILPRLIDLCMRNEEATRYRSRIVPEARGKVLEIGIGSGLNLPFYREGVERLYGVDPSEALLALARKKAHATHCPVEFLECSAESIPLADCSVDTVVMTFTLCSIPDPGRALREMRRVLKPQGVLLFAEHGLAPETGVQRWQRRLTPLWRRIGGGCHLDRKMDALIGEAGFSMAQLVTEYARGPRPMAYIYCGRALPA